MKKENSKLTLKEVEKLERETNKSIRDHAKRNGITIVIHGEQGTGKTIAALKIADLLFGAGYKVDVFDAGTYVRRIGSFTENKRSAVIDTTLKPYNPRKRT